MILNQQRKIENAVIFFACKYKEHFGFWPKQMWIYKLLALLDYNILKATGRPCLGLEYVALQNGPVPTMLYDNRRGELPYKGFTLEEVWYNTFELRATQEPNLKYFSEAAIYEMENLVSKFILSVDVNKASSNTALDELIEATHQLKAWQIAMELAEEKGRKRIPMDYADEFPKDIYTKPINDLTWQEEVFLDYESKQKAELVSVE